MAGDIGAIDVDGQGAQDAPEQQTWPATRTSPPCTTLPHAMKSVPTEPRLPVGRRKRAHDVADKLEALIAADEFGVGSRLPSEKELMARFGVGRPAVREALFMLQQQGRIEIGSGARALVVSPTPAFLVRQMGELIKRVADGPRGQDHLEQARLLFETGRCLAGGTERDRSRTSSDCGRRSTPTSPRSADVGEFIRTDVAFHYELARSSRAIPCSTWSTRSWSSG